MSEEAIISEYKEGEEIDIGKIKALVKDLINEHVYGESHRVEGIGTTTEEYCLKQLIHIEYLLDGCDVDIWWLNKHSSKGEK